MSTWDSAVPPPSLAMTAPQRMRAAWRFAVLALCLVLALLVLALLRLPETVTRVGTHRYAAQVVRLYCRLLLRVVGLRVDKRGAVTTARGALVANHASWLDIFVLNAAAPATFVAKAEVAGWPGIGLVARMAGTVFIRRDRRDAQAQARLLAAQIRRGHRLAFFPEGTSTDTTCMLPFKTTLFQALLAPDMPHGMAVQPVSLRYYAPHGADSRFYGWWGRMEFASHFMRVLGQGQQGRVRVTFHAPVPCLPSTNRKALAAASETAVRAGFAAG